LDSTPHYTNKKKTVNLALDHSQKMKGRGAERGGEWGMERRKGGGEREAREKGQVQNFN
jgi:hypothetical protein